MLECLCVIVVVVVVLAVAVAGAGAGAVAGDGAGAGVVVNLGRTVLELNYASDGIKGTSENFPHIGTFKVRSSV